MSESNRPLKERKLLMRTLGVLLFIFVLVAAVTVVGVVSFNALLSLDEDLRREWAEVQRLQDARRGLLVEMVSALHAAGFRPQIEAQWRSAQAAVDTASSFDEEVRTGAVLNDSVDGLLSEIRRGAPAGTRPGIAASLRDVEELSTQIGVACRRYNDAVRIYLRELHRIPNRWLAGLFGFGEVYEYQEPVGAAG